MKNPGKIVSVKWDAGEPPTVGADGKLVPGAEFTDLYPTEILDIPETAQQVFDRACDDSLAEYHAGQESEKE